MSRVLVHIGFPKTASTFLQRRLWCDSEHVNSIGKPRRTAAAAELGRYIREADEPCFQRALDYLREELLVELCCSRRLNVLSDELLSMGNGWSYGLRPPRCDRMRIAERLRTLFPQASILILVRPQSALLESLYLQARRTRGSEKRFEAWLMHQRYANRRGSVVSALDYHATACRYRDLFGVQNVHVVDYGAFLNAKDEFSLELAKITGLDNEWIGSRLTGEAENRRAGGTELWAERAAYKLPWLAKLRGRLSGRSKARLRRILRALGGPGDLSLSPQNRSWLEWRYSQANAGLRSEFGVDIPVIEAKEASGQ